MLDGSTSEDEDDITELSLRFAKILAILYVVVVRNTRGI